MIAGAMPGRTVTGRTAESPGGVTDATHGPSQEGNPRGVSTHPAPALRADFGPDRSLELLRHGYLFWDTLRRLEGTEVVQARLLHERATAIRGGTAAEFFYEQPGTERSSALPTALIGPLFGRGPVHQLDGAAHAHRKSLFTGLLDAHASTDVVSRVARLWDERVAHWHRSVDLFDEVGQVLFEAGCEWIGIGYSAEEVPGRTRDMLAMVDGFGSPGPRNLRARRARKRTDAWMSGLIRRSRDGDDHGSPLDRVARFRDENGELLPVHTAAVEAVNLLRPLVAVSWLTAGLFRAYADHPDLGAGVASGVVSPFHVANEVRRTQPFVPFLATRATQDLSFEGALIPAGTLIVLDVWGTNHDPRLWSRPDEFDPTRFAITPVTPYNLVPQGGGFTETGHRCPGEDLTLAVLTVLADRVARFSWRLEEGPAGLRRMPPEPHQRVTRLE